MATNSTIVAGVGRAPASNRGGRFQGLRDAYARWQERARIRGELMQMTSRELADLGLTASDIDDVASGTYRRGE